MPEKMCVRCGAKINIEDWYSFISTKYCESCKADRERERRAAWMRSKRKCNKEERDALSELNMEQRIMIDNLRAEIVRLRSENRRLRGEQ